MSEIENDAEGEAFESELAEATGKPMPPRKPKPSKEELCTVLDYLVNDPVLANGMRCIGRQPNTIFVWAKASREGDSRFLLRWPDKDGAEVWFHDAIVVARQMNLAQFEAILRRDCSLGTPRTLRRQDGEPIWETDPVLVAKYKDRESADAAGVFDWPYLHDQKGGRIAVVVYDAAPAALRQHVARSTLAGFNPSDRKEVDTRHSGGVMIVRATTQGPDGRPVPPYSRAAMGKATGDVIDAEAVEIAPGAGDSTTGHGRGEPTPLQRDLLRRLQDLRARPDRASARPTRPVDYGAGKHTAGDPPEGGAA